MQEHFSTIGNRFDTFRSLPAAKASFILATATHRFPIEGRQYKMQEFQVLSRLAVPDII